MKTITFSIITILAIICIPAKAQEFKETIKKELSFKSRSDENFLIVNNVYGSITVEGYSGSAIKIEAYKTIHANNARTLELGKTEIGVKTAVMGNHVHIYLDSPFSMFNAKTGNFSHNEYNRGLHHHERKYDYIINFKIKIPSNTNIELYAVNDGNVNVKNVHAKEISVSNINGAITLDNISGQTYANALNKDINISYKSIPTMVSTYKSLNGDINITVKENLNANVSFKSLNGDFYTNFKTSKLNAQTVVKVSRSKSTKYKLNSNDLIKIGNGGVELRFDVLNGDVTIKNNKS